MPLAIFLRRRVNKNHFRDLLISAVNTGIGNNALMCSGFFQEARNSVYEASSEPNFAASFVNNDIELTTVGVHNYSWKNSYENFRDGMKSKGVNITALYKIGMRWHSKIFILSKDETPLFGIIGSSNITRNAFSDTTPFNNECDVVLWTDNANKIGALIDDNAEGNNFPYEVIRVQYDSNLNTGISITDRLKRLKEEILSENLGTL